MVFGLQKIQDELFCMTEERNYFQGKYLEQVSEIVALKEELRKARRETLKLRGELMETSSSCLMADDASWHESTSFQTPPKNNRRRSRRTSSAVAEEHQEEKKEAEEGSSSAQQQPTEEEVDDAADDQNEYDDDDDSDEDTEAADIRQSAEKLLQWASYRSYNRSSATNSPGNGSPDQGSVSSGQQAALQADSSASLLGAIPHTIESASLKNAMSHDSSEAAAAAAAAP